MRVNILLSLVIAAPVFCADWNPRLAADYLDARQKAWMEWPQAKTASGVCVSCHTGATYLLARPALRRALGENEPTAYEKALLAGLPALAEAKGNIQGAETVFAALFVPGSLGRLWSAQSREGKDAGAWKWYDASLDPWEMPESPFYGAALAAVAVGRQNGGQRSDGVSALTAYLQREEKAQPLHNRLALLWACSKLPEALPKPKRQAIIDEVLRKQEADGGWNIESLGPWKPHPGAPPSTGSNSYATAYVAFILQQAGVARSNPAVARAIEWVKAHQNPRTGSWAADSLNHVYPPDSMQSKFMTDAATAFAVMALLN